MESISSITSNIFPAITDHTTLGELLGMLNLGEKPRETPTPKLLRETAGSPIGAYPNSLGVGEGGLLYANGYAVWDNGSGRTVVWLPDCVAFTYHCVKPKDTEIGTVSEKETLPDGILESCAWPIAVTLIGEHRIEQNSMNRTGSRAGTRDYDSNGHGDKNGDTEDTIEKMYRSEYFWREDRFGENPEATYMRKETLNDLLDEMTEKQREVFTLYYKYGYTQREIAEMLGLARTTVLHRLEGAAKKIEKNYF